MDVKKKLLALMEEKHWTYYRLSKEADVSWSTIRNMFDRGTEPTLPTPLTVKHEAQILKQAGFSSVQILREWGTTFTLLARR